MNYNLQYFSLSMILVVGLEMAPLESADLWSQFRGERGDGMVSNPSLPIEWSETKNVRWFCKLPGLGWSSPVAVNGRIYLTTSVAANDDLKLLAGAQQLRLICLNAKDGAVIFDRQVFEQDPESPKVHNKNSHASPTPVVEGDRIYLHFGHQGSMATDLEGNVVWMNRNNAYLPTHGNGSSPLIVDELFIVTCDGGDKPCTLALNKTTGEEVWRTIRDVEADRKFSFCTPSVFDVQGKKQIVSAGSNAVQGLDPRDGSVLWSVRYDGYSVVPKPIMSHGLVLVCTGFGPTTLLAIDPTGHGDVTDTHVHWKYKSPNVPKTSSLIAFEDLIVMSSDQGVGAAVNAHTGEEVWKIRLGGNYSASPLLNGNVVYLQSEQGDAKVMRLHPTEEPQELMTNTLSGRIFASYAVVENDLLIRAEDGLYRIGL